MSVKGQRVQVKKSPPHPCSVCFQGFSVHCCLAASLSDTDPVFNPPGNRIHASEQSGHENMLMHVEEMNVQLLGRVWCFQKL